MTDMLKNLMSEATRLTRGGQLHEATRAIQRALQGGSFDVFGAHAPAAPRPDAPARPAQRTPAADPLVLDGLTRVVDRPDPPSGAGTRAGPQAQAVQHDERWLDGSFAHQGRTLAYKLYLPPRAAGAAPTPRPLVLMLHGCTQGAADFAAGTQMNALARERGVVVLYPEQAQHANAQKCWNWFKTQHQQRGRGEPAVLAALTQSIAAEHQVDPARVYVAGLSAGGAMADIVGRCYPDVFAAVGVHSGLPSGSATDVMSAMAAMQQGSGKAGPKIAGGAMLPTIVFHGDADSTVHASNGAAIVEDARSANEPTAAGRPAGHAAEGRSSAGQRYTRTVYSGQEGRSTVEYWQLHGAGHAWSGGSRRGSFTDPAGVDASAEMLRFFLAHPRQD